MGSKPSSFVREATGLVRSLSTLDVLALGIIGITPGATLVVFYVYIPFLYPGVDMTLGVIGSIVPSLIFGTTYYFLSASMPRSGGDYVYGSRIIHPLWGFLPNWMYTFVNVSALGFYASTVGGSYLAVFFAMLGNFFNNSTLNGWASYASSLNGAFLIALVAIWVSAVVNIAGMALYRRVQIVLFIIAMLGILVLLGVLAVNSNQSFQAAFNAYAATYHTNYTGIISQATNAGWQPQSFSLVATLLALPYIAGFSLATVWPVIPAGEARQPQKSMLYGTVVAIAISGLIFLVTSVLFYGVVGDSFAKAMGYISNCGCTTNPLPVGPYIQYLTSMLTNNPAVIFFLGFSFFIWSIILLPAFYLITTRSIFAWSFDRIVPSFLADVNERFHVPLKSILLVGALSSVMGALSLYTSYVGFAFNLTLATVSCFVFAGVAAAAFPYVKRARSIYDQAPAVVRRKVAGVPIVTIFGAAEAIIFSYLTYLDATSPALSGPINPSSLGLILAMYAAAILIYFGAKAYRKGQGLDLDAVFKELPPE
jgi:basic amino acid/polyamine antiporter, APA family